MIMVLNVWFYLCKWRKSGGYAYKINGYCPYTDHCDVASCHRYFCWHSLNCNSPGVEKLYNYLLTLLTEIMVVLTEPHDKFWTFLLILQTIHSWQVGRWTFLSLLGIFFSFISVTTNVITPCSLYTFCCYCWYNCEKKKKF